MALKPVLFHSFSLADVATPARFSPYRRDQFVVAIMHHNTAPPTGDARCRGGRGVAYGLSSSSMALTASMASARLSTSNASPDLASSCASISFREPILYSGHALCGNKYGSTSRPGSNSPPQRKTPSQRCGLGRERLGGVAEGSFAQWLGQDIRSVESAGSVGDGKRCGSRVVLQEVVCTEYRINVFEAPVLCGALGDLDASKAIGQDLRCKAWMSMLR